MSKINVRRIGLLALLSVFFLILLTSSCSAATVYIAGTNSAGVTYSVSESGIYRFTITGGSYSRYASDDLPGAYWSNEVYIYYNKQIVWVPDALNGGLLAPGNPDYSIGYGVRYPSGDAAWLAGAGALPVDVHMEAGSSVTLICPDHLIYYNDDRGGMTVSVEKYTPLPVAAFDATPLSGPAPLKVTFTDKSTGDGITSRGWQYKLEPDSIWTPFTLDKKLSYKFINAGVYDVKLTVTGTGGSAEAFKVISIIPKISVKIDGKNTLTLADPAYVSQVIPYSATVSPKGGSYKWEITKGADKAEILGYTTLDSIDVRPKAESTDKEDVQLNVTYTLYGQSVKKSMLITVQKPKSLKMLKAPHTKKSFLNVYITTLDYQVRDQSGQNPINDVMKAEELWTMKCSNDDPMFLPDKPYSKTQYTSARGTFGDLFTASNVPRPLPSNLYTCLNQKIWVEGWPMPIRHIEYFSTYANVSLGECPC